MFYIVKHQTDVFCIWFTVMSSATTADPAQGIFLLLYFCLLYMVIFLYFHLFLTKHAHNIHAHTQTSVCKWSIILLLYFSKYCRYSYFLKLIHFFYLFSRIINLPQKNIIYNIWTNWPLLIKHSCIFKFNMKNSRLSAWQRNTGI